MFTGGEIVIEDSTILADVGSPAGVMFTGTQHTESVISRVEALYARLEQIREDSNSMAPQEKRVYYDQLNAITDKQTALNKQLGSLKTASVSSYDEIKNKIEESILEIEMLLTQMRRNG